MKQLAALLLAVAACGTTSPEDSAVPSPALEPTTNAGILVGDAPTWSVGHTTNEGMLLGVWGSAPDDVWAVGGVTDAPLVMHYDGSTWSRIPVPGQSLLWNVYGFSRTDVYAVGEHGLVLHYDGHTWTSVDVGTDRTIFGLWGASGADVWLAGGSILDAPGSAVLLRGSGSSFAPVADLATELRPSVLFKVHGFGSNDLVAVGSTGALRWDGTTWSRQDVPTTGPLRSTWGTGPDDIYAVGGRDSAEITHYDGQSWTLVTQASTGFGLSGVFAGNDGPAIAVGAAAAVFEVSGESSLSMAHLPDLGADRFLHGVWGDGEGTTYVVGGDSYATPDAMTGVILVRR